MSSREGKTYELYEIFNDYNRLLILLNLYDEELSVEDLIARINLKKAIIYNQLEYLTSCKVLRKNVIDEINYYKIQDKALNKLVGSMITYVKK